MLAADGSGLFQLSLWASVTALPELIERVATVWKSNQLKKR
jgi:hypothetical protein